MRRKDHTTQIKHRWWLRPLWKVACITCVPLVQEWLLHHVGTWRWTSLWGDWSRLSQYSDFLLNSWFSNNYNSQFTFFSNRYCRNGAARELSERGELNLPPFSRSIVLEVENSEATSIVSGFKKALLDSRLPASTKVLGPAQKSGDSSRILLTADLDQGEQLLKFVGDYMRHRAVTKKKSISIRVDPYSLT